jgi:hypothetical protein
MTAHTAEDLMSLIETYRATGDTKFRDEIRARLRALVPVNANLNQCDGCRQGAPLKGILHVDQAGKAFMVCERRVYAKEQP